MNTLNYQIMGVLAKKPCSGYDIYKQLANFRPAGTSQIYPLLSKMEKQGFITHNNVIQITKPSKKIYSLTETGRQILIDWIGTKPEDPVVKDDFLTMLYSSWLKDTDTIINLLKDRIDFLERKLMFISNVQKDLKEEKQEEIKVISNWEFSHLLLIDRRIRLTKEEIIWCQDVLKLIQSTTKEKK